MNPQPEPLVEAIAEPAVERRRRPDRRTRPTSPWAAIWPGGRRAKNRRAEDRRRPYFVDRFSSAELVFVLALVAGSLIDAGLTIYILLDGGGAEVNPLMRCLLDRGIDTFVIGKYLVTVVGLPVLLIFNNHRVFGMRVGRFIPVAVALYAVLISYQIVLIHTHIGW
jgi:hypothetical protein